MICWGFVMVLMWVVSLSQLGVGVVHAVCLPLCAGVAVLLVLGIWYNGGKQKQLGVMERGGG